MGRIAVLMAVAMVMVLAAAVTCGADPPEGYGLAASYPGDAGIASDPNVVFVEQFEEATLADMLARWDDVGTSSIMSLVADVPPGSAGAKSLLMSHTPAETGAYLFTNFTGYDTVYVRFYTKFLGSQIIHHYVWLGGQNPPLGYPYPHAGSLPAGDEYFSSAFEPNGCGCTTDPVYPSPVSGYNWQWDSYNYWPGMRKANDNNYWGNSLNWGGNWAVPLDQWLCVEFMVKMNTVGSYDGEMTMWINGQLQRKDGQIVSWLRTGLKGEWVGAGGHFAPNAALSTTFEGFNWRTTTALKANYLWLEYYLDPATSQCYFDDVVVAKSYIGPIYSGPAVPAANFTGNPTSGYVPLTVAFTDTSTNSPTSWSWTFGDGGTSAAQNPSHTYNNAGQYTVSLTATNAYGSDTETKTNYITVTGPTFVAAGAVAYGTGAITPALPAGIATNDILLLFLETANQAISISNQNGGTWTVVASSPQGTGTGAASDATRLTVFWSRYNGTQGAPTASDSGNHQLGRIIAIRGATTSGSPWDVTAGGVEATADTSGAIPGATTTVANTLVVAAIATALPDASGTANFSAWANSNLTSVAERTDNTRNSGNGGGLGIATGERATAGAYGNTTVTCASSAKKAMMSIALKR